MKRIQICLLFLLGTAAAQDRPRVYVQAASHGNTWNARRDQSIEMAKDFERNCPGVLVSIFQNKADYTIILNHIEVGLFARDNQIEVANREGDLLATREKGGIKGSVKGVCSVILADWLRQNPPQPAVAPASAEPPGLDAPDTSVSARLSFAEGVDKKLRREDSGFAEVDNTTLVVRSAKADKNHYDALVGNYLFVAELRRRGFTRLIYISDQDKTFMWDAAPPEAATVAAAGIVDGPGPKGNERLVNGLPKNRSKAATATDNKTPRWQDIGEPEL